MKKIKQLYRKDYAGEEIVANMTHTDKKWDIAKEWIPNSVINNQISNRAVVIGNGPSQADINLTAIFTNFGGLLASKKFQTYGCNALYRDYDPDFLVVTGPSDGIVAEVARTGYADNHVVYADASDIQFHPGKFYLIPQDPGWNSGSLATYIAAFDGHTTIYLVGFDHQDQPGCNYNVYAGTPNYQNATGAQADPKFWEITMAHVFETYPEVDFVRVMPGKYAPIPESWKYLTNVRQISFREFVLEADI
jgi:hypothetical protein